MKANPRIRRIALSGATALALAIAMAPSVADAGRCARHETMLEVLDKKFQEKRRALGLFSSSGLMELFVAKTGTWTVLMTSPQGISCIVAAGHTWEEVPVSASEPAA